MYFSCVSLTLSRTVSVGDVISLAQRFEQLNDKVVSGRNFDDRVGVYTMLEAMKRVGDCQVDIYAVATVQEEVGLRGVPTAAYAIDPDIGIAIDGSLASDIPYAREEDKGESFGSLFFHFRQLMGSPTDDLCA